MINDLVQIIGLCINALVLKSLNTFFSLYEKGGLHNHLQYTYLFPTPNIKGLSCLSDYACH